jgi:hypothetical protein
MQALCGMDVVRHCLGRDHLMSWGGRCVDLPPAYASTLVGYAFASLVPAHAVLYRPEPASLAKIQCQRSVRHGTDDEPGLPGASDR